MHWALHGFTFKCHWDDPAHTACKGNWNEHWSTHGTAVAVNWKACSVNKWERQLFLFTDGPKVFGYLILHLLFTPFWRNTSLHCLAIRTAVYRICSDLSAHTSVCFLNQIHISSELCGFSLHRSTCADFLLTCCGCRKSHDKNMSLK